MSGQREAPLGDPVTRVLALVTTALALATWGWWPAIVAYPGTAVLDGRYFHHQFEIAKAAVRRYHELPLWNAFDCHGIPMWDHPENITGSPIFWLTLPLSATATLIVWHIIHCAMGFVGMWLLARDEVKLSRMSALVAASVWALGVCHTTQYAGGHEALISFYNAPLLLYLWLRAEKSWNAAVGCGLVIAWMAYDGATYPLPFTLVMLALSTVFRLWPLERGIRVLAAALVVGIVGFGVGAARLLPLIDQLGAHKRLMEPDLDHIGLPMLVRMYTLRSAGYLNHYADQQYVLGEYLTYIGWTGVGLAFLGLFSASAELWWLFGLAMLVFLFMMGHFAKFAPWTLLHENVFPFKSMRVAARFRLLLMLPISLWIAISTERVPQLVRRFSAQWGALMRTALVGLALLAVGDIAGLGQELIVPRFAGAPEQKVVASTRFHYGGPGLTPDTIDQPRQNRAYTGCRSAWAWYSGAPLWSGDVPQARAAEGANAVVEVANRTHNTFTVDVDAKSPSRILLNSAYEIGWRSNVGSVVQDNQLLAVDLPAGRHRLSLRYWPRRLTLGMSISAVSLLGVAAFFARKRIRRALPSNTERRSAPKLKVV